MNANEMISNSQLAQLNIEDTDTSLDGSKTFADIKDAVVKAINIVDQALPKMKAAGQNMKEASYQVDGLMRNIIRKGWGGIEVEFYITHNGSKAITAVTQRHLDDIISQVAEYTKSY